MDDLTLAWNRAGFCAWLGENDQWMAGMTNLTCYLEYNPKEDMEMTRVVIRGPKEAINRVRYCDNGFVRVEDESGAYRIKQHMAVSITLDVPFILIYGAFKRYLDFFLDGIREFDLLVGGKALETFHALYVFVYEPRLLDQRFSVENYEDLNRVFWARICDIFDLHIEGDPHYSPSSPKAPILREVQNRGSRVRPDPLVFCEKRLGFIDNLPFCDQSAPKWSISLVRERTLVVLLTFCNHETQMLKVRVEQPEGCKRMMKDVTFEKGPNARRTKSGSVVLTISYSDLYDEFKKELDHFLDVNATDEKAVHMEAFRRIYWFVYEPALLYNLTWKESTLEDIDYMKAVDKIFWRIICNRFCLEGNFNC